MFPPKKSWLDTFRKKKDVCIGEPYLTNTKTKVWVINELKQLQKKKSQLCFNFRKTGKLRQGVLISEKQTEEKKGFESGE